MANYPFATIEPNTGIVQVPDPRLDALAEHREAGAHRPGSGGVRGHRRAGQGRERGRRAGQPVPGEHPRGGRHRPRGPLLRGRRRPARHGRGRPGARPRDHQHRAGARRSGERREAARQGRPGPPSPATLRPSSSSACWSGAARPLPPASPARAVVLPTEEEPPTLPRRSTCSPRSRCSTPPTWPRTSSPAGNQHVDALRAALTPEQRDGRGRHLLRQGRGRARRAGAGETGASSWNRSGSRSRASTAWPTRRITCSGLQSYFTAGEKEVRAWTIHRGDKAPAAAGVIHSDFEKGFIRAETVAYDDFVRVGGWKPRARAGTRPGRRQGIRGPGRRRHAVPVQQLNGSGLRPPSRHASAP